MYKGLKKLGVFISCILLPLVVYGAPTSGATSYDSSWAGGHVSMMEDGYIASPADDRYDMGGSSFTVEFWVYANASYSYGSSDNCDERMLFEYGEGWNAGKTYQVTSCSDDNLKFKFTDTDALEVKIDYDWTDGSWHHIAGVFDNENNKSYLYINGELKGQGSGTDEPGSMSPSPIHFGARYNGSTAYNLSSIKIDEFRLWNDPRTATEIQQSMYKQLDGNETNLVAYYKFDEKYGNTIEDTSQNPLHSTAYNLGGDDKWIYSNAAPSIETIEEQFISEDTNITLLVSDPDNDELNITATLADTTLGDIQSNTLWEQIGGDIYGEAEGDYSAEINKLSLSKDGKRVAIGAFNNEANGNRSGHVRVFEEVDGNWVQLGDDIDGQEEDRSGSSVSLSADGNRVAIGEIGSNSVKVYDFNGTQWNQLGNNIQGEVNSEYGYSVGLSDDGKTVAIGARGYDLSAGKVEVYSYNSNNNSWEQLGSALIGEDDNDKSGTSISLSRDGKVIAIGAPKNNNSSGHVRIYNYNGSSWNQLGADIDGMAENDRSGSSVSLSGDGMIVAIGAYLNSNLAPYAGHTRVFKYDGSSWNQLGTDINGKIEHDQSGYSVSLSDDGKTVAIGAMYNDEIAFASGKAKIYKYNGTDWNQIGSDINGKVLYEYSGSSISLNKDGDKVAIGGYGASNSKGLVRVYKLSNLLQISPNETASGTTQATVTLQDGTHETNTTFNATFCQDGNCPPKSINLTSTTVDENAQTATQVGTLSSEDERGETHTYSFCGGTDDGSFSLDANALQTAEVFDYESKSSYEVCIRSTDSANNTLEKNYTITVNDIQEAPQIDSIDNMTIDTHISMGLNVFDPENDSFNLTASIENSSLADVSISKKWQQVGAEINGENPNDFLAYQHGVSFSKDGKRVAVGAMYNSDGGNSAGHVRVYEQVDGNWVQLGANINGKEATEFSGSSVSLSADGNRVAIGASGANKARVYEYDGNTWNQLGSDITETIGKFGTSISLSSDGSIVAIGAYQYTSDNKPQSGLVRILQYDATSQQWVQLGDDIYGESESDLSGFSISLDDSGTVVAIGAYASDTQTGQVRVYKYESSSWTQLGADIDGEVSGDRSGWSVALSSDGTIVAIGAHENDGVNGSNSGHVRVYKYESSSWTQLGADIDGEASGDKSGHSVALSSDGTILAVGAMRANNTKGEVKIYNYNSESWEHSVTIDGQGTFSGSSISLSGDGDKVAVGAYPINANSGQVKVYASSNILNIAPKDSASGSTQITLSADDGTSTSTETFIATFCQNGVCPPTDISLSSLSVPENSKA
ncbi:MAG: LamG-like jellyroll fold domain-containing protein, partial [Campylobacterota bacterium]